MSEAAVKFVADASQFVDESKKASQSALNVAASAEQARQRIVASYQQQMKAASELGSSQRQLEQITRRATQQLADVTDDNARRYINSLDRMEERTKRFNAARGTLSNVKVSQPTTFFDLGGYASETQGAKELAEAVDGVSVAHSRGVSSAVQFGSVIRGLEGNFGRNIRAAEVFGSTLSFLGPVMEAAFPVVGALTLVGVLGEMGKHAYDVYQNIVNLRSAIQGLNQLQIKVESGHTEAEDKQEGDVESILEKTVGRSAALKQKYSYQSQKPLNLSSYFYSDQFKNLPNDVKGTLEQTYKNVAPADAQARIASITKTVNDLQSAITGVKNGTVGAFLPVINGKGPGATRDPLSYYTAQLTAAKQIQTQLQDATGVRSASLQAIQTDAASAQGEENTKAADKAQTQAKKSADARLAAAKTKLAELELQGNVSIKWQFDYWTQLTDAFAKGSSQYNEVVEKQRAIAVDGAREAHTQLEVARRAIAFQANLGNGASLAADGSYAAGSLSTHQAAVDASDQGKGTIDQAHNAAAQRLAEINSQVGISLTRLGAAAAIAAVHTQEFGKVQSALQITLAARQADYKRNPSESNKTALDAAQKQLDDVNSARYIQTIGDQDRANPQATSGVEGFRDAINDFVAASIDAAAQMKELTNNILSGLNNTFLHVLTTPHETGRQTHAAFANYGAGLFKDVAGIGLNKVEGTALGALGLGGGKMGSSANNPLWVRLADGVKGGAISAASGIGGFVKSVFGGGKGPGQAGLDAALSISRSAASSDPISTISSALLPGLAVGGNADANSSYLIGERGPEVLTMGSQSGRVTPNSQIGGDVHYHTHNVDARGATDPAQVVAAVDRRMKQWAPQMTASSLHAANEARKRTSPGNYR